MRRHPALILGFTFLLAWTSSPALAVDLFLAMPSTTFNPGDTFSLQAVARNDGPATNAQLVLIFDGFGETLFYPGFTSTFETEPVSLPNGSTTIEIFPPFTWQNTGSSASGLTFAAALFSEDMGTLLAGPTEITWGYTGFPEDLRVRPEAYLFTGPIPGEQNQWILPTGRRITPVGDLTEVDGWPLSMWVSPDDRYVIVSHTGRDPAALSVLDLATRQVVSTIEDEQYFVGLDGTSDGRTIYASTSSDQGLGTEQVVGVFDFNAGMLSLRDELVLGGDPAGLTLSPDDSRLYVVTQTGNLLVVFDTTSGDILGSVEVGGEPYGVVHHPTRDIVYVSVEGPNEVKAIDVSDVANPTITATWQTEKNPEHLQLNDTGSRLYVANADEDSVTVIDLDQGFVVRNIDLRPAGVSAYGSSPNALWVSESQNRLYIAEAARDAITVLNLQTGTLIGRIPTGWFPSSVVLNQAEDTVIIANAKGVGAGGDRLDSLGRIQFTTIPSDADLATGNDIAIENNLRPGALYDIDPATHFNPIPAVRGVPSQQIEHVFIVVKENKTYDSVLGDWGPGNGDSNFCLFCGDETVNQEKLADTFASADNYYSSAEVSVQGHCILTMGMTNTYVDKSWQRGKQRPIQLDQVLLDVAYPKNASIFTHCIKHGFTFRNHGQAVGAGKDGIIFNPQYTHWGTFDPPIWNPISYDVDKLAERIQAWEAPGFKMPDLVYMLFPNDHGLGRTYPFPTLRSMVADNDMAAGQFVEWLSNSEYWENSVAFIFEDDPQQGRDHIDRHRSFFFVVSPWAKRGYVSNVHYSEANMWATVQYILGMPPMTIHDEVAQPMYDMFTMTPDFTPFTHIPRIYPEEFNPPATRLAHQSKSMNFVEIDEAEGLQELVWESRLLDRAMANPENGMTASEREWAANWLELYRQFHDLRALRRGDDE